MAEIEGAGDMGAGSPSGFAHAEYTSDRALAGIGRAIIDEFASAEYSAAHFAKGSAQILENQQHKANADHQAVLGSTESADTNDPTYLSHDGEHYLFSVPSGSYNYASAPTYNLSSKNSLRVVADFTIGLLNSSQTLGGKWRSTASTRSFALGLNSSNGLFLYVSDGTTSFFNGSSAPIDFTVGDRVVVEASFLSSGALSFTYSINGGPDVTIAGGSVSGWTSFPSHTDLLTVGGGYLNSIANWSGRVYSFEAWDADTGGTKFIDFNPNRDIDVLSDPDAGQTSWTGADSVVWTMQRASSGLTETLVTRPVLVFDGTDDYIVASAADATAFSSTTGKHTVVVAYRMHSNAISRHLWSGTSVSNGGPFLYITSAGVTTASVGDGTIVSSTAGTSVTNSALRVAGAVFDDGTVTAYDSTHGIGSGVSYTAKTGLIHADNPRLGSSAAGGASVFKGEMIAAAFFPNVSLSKRQLDAVSTCLRNEFA